MVLTVLRTFFVPIHCNRLIGILVGRTCIIYDHMHDQHTFTGVRTRGLGGGGGGGGMPPSYKHRGGRAPLHLAVILYSLLYCHVHVKDLLVIGALRVHQN